MSGMSEPLILAAPFASDLGRLALELRRAVFIIEQGVPEAVERDEYDAAATHVVALLDGTLVGVARIVFLDEHVKIGRVAVAKSARGRGLATSMMHFAMDFARARGETKFYLTAQTDKLALYEKLGFVAFGEEFEDGGMPHLAMKTY